MEAKLCPEAGANVYSLVFKGRELLRTPPSLEELAGHRYGFPILHPCPGRVRNSRFSFEGRVYNLPGQGGKPYIHGFACREPWEVEEASDSSARLVLNVQPGTHAYEVFPWRHRVGMRVKFDFCHLIFEIEVQNLDSKHLPFGFGFHPYFKIPGERKDVWIKIPAPRRHLFEGKVPTGKLADVGGGPFDLREFRSLEGLVLDEPYAGLGAGEALEAEFKSLGLKLKLRASEIFGQAVVFAPREQDFFCLENWSSSPDAHNLYAKGFEKESGLLVLDPGESVSGRLDLEVSG